MTTPPKDFATRIMEELFSEQQPCPRKWWRWLQTGKPTGLGPVSFEKTLRENEAFENYLKNDIYPNTDTDMTKNHLNSTEHDHLVGLLTLLNAQGSQTGDAVLSLRPNDLNWSSLIDRAEQLGLIRRSVMGFAALFHITPRGKAWLAIAKQPPTERRWQTKDGRSLTPVEMSVEHLFNALAWAARNTVDTYWVTALAEEIRKRGASIPEGAVAAKDRLDELEKRLANAKAALA